MGGKRQRNKKQEDGEKNTEKETASADKNKT
jgi:hypothetical protein